MEIKAIMRLQSIRGSLLIHTAPEGHYIQVVFDEYRDASPVILTTHGKSLYGLAGDIESITPTAVVPLQPGKGLYDYADEIHQCLERMSKRYGVRNR